MPNTAGFPFGLPADSGNGPEHATAACPGWRAQRRIGKAHPRYLLKSPDRAIVMISPPKAGRGRRQGISLPRISQSISMLRSAPTLPSGHCAGGQHLPGLINDVRMNGLDVRVRQIIVKSTHALGSQRTL